MNQTADLLEALRRRRGEREAAAYDDDPFEDAAPTSFAPPVSSHPSTGAIRIVNIPTEVPTAESSPTRTTAPAAVDPQHGSASHGFARVARRCRPGTRSFSARVPTTTWPEPAPRVEP